MKASLGPLLELPLRELPLLELRAAVVVTSVALLAACRPSNDGQQASAALMASASAAPTVKLLPPPAPAPRGRINARSAVGYNLDYPGDWTGMPPFIDYMKNARAWRGECGDGQPSCDPVAHLNLDESGWVKSTRFRDDPKRSYSHVEVVVVTNQNPAADGRQFVVDWQGEGAIDLFNAAVEVNDPEHKRLIFKLQQGPMYVRVLASDPQNNGRYLKNIRVYPVDQSALLARGAVFNPEMLDYLAPFGSLRFMDWMESNKAGVCSGGPKNQEDCYAGGCPGGRCVMAGTWSERPRPEQAALFSRSQYLDHRRPELGVRVGGYPVETLVALANEVGADPHFNMPALFDDGYVKEFAGYVKSHLAPGLRATVEYSNETWNWGFPQAQYVNIEGRKLWPKEGSAWVQFAGSRMQRMCELWKGVFGDESKRMRCLISPQTGWLEMGEAMLDCPAWAASHPEHGKCYRAADALSITGYFSGCLQQKQNQGALVAWLQQGQAKALDRFFEQLELGKHFKCEGGENTQSLDETIGRYKAYKQMADARGLELYVYESGTHFDYDEQASQKGSALVKQLFVAASRDPRMARLYRKNLEAFKAAGGTIFNAWGWIANNDMWANSDSLQDRVHPKYRALVDFAQNEPCWWKDCDRSRR